MRTLVRAYVRLRESPWSLVVAVALYAVALVIIARS